MTKKIDKAIIKVSIKDDEGDKPIVPFVRPYKLDGSTYKIKPPTMSAALYVTINDVILDNGARRPLELFLASKDVTDAQWMIAVTRLMSAIFRLPVPFDFAIAELKEVIDPKGSYFIPGTQSLCGGIAAHVGRVIEEHCINTGTMVKTEQDPNTREELERKNAEGDALGIQATDCKKCGARAVVMLDGCETCTACGDSKCG